MVASAGTVEVTSDDIRLTSLLGVFTIRWDEIRYVEIDRQRSSLVFRSGDKRLPIVGAPFSRGPHVSAMRRLIEGELRHRQIPIHTTQLAMWRLRRNVRVST